MVLGCSLGLQRLKRGGARLVLALASLLVEGEALEHAVYGVVELRQTLEEHADLTLHAVVGGDLLLHATRGHADALREAAPVRAVVPLLPELKVSPHFFALRKCLAEHFSLG